MKRPAKRNPSRRRAAPKSKGTSGAILAERIAVAPKFVDAKAARARFADWLSGLNSAEKPLKILLAKNPTARALLESLAESSPFLWDLVSRDPKRLLRLLQNDPDRHLASSLSAYGRDIASSKDEVEAMRLLRRMSESLVRLQRDEFNPKEALNPDRLSDLDLVMQDAIAGKFLEKPLTPEQLAEFIQIPHR